MEITSLDNNLIKHISSLHQKKYRDLYNEFIIEGSNLISEAVKFQFKISHIIYTSEYKGKLPDNYNLVLVSQKVFKKISDTVTPDGIMAICSIPTIHKPLNSCKIVFLDRVQDPGNVGAIIRNADAFGFDLVMLSRACADPYSLKTLRSTTGSIFHIPVMYNLDSIKALSTLKTDRYKIYSSCLYNSSPLEETLITSPFVLIIGNEGGGISEEIKDISTHLIRIDMPGRAESLNASVASGILMYEFSKARMLN